MAYTERNYRTKAELKRDHAAGTPIPVYQPGPFGSAVRDGAVSIEGPHYPEPHRWYARVDVKDGQIVPGSKIR